MKPWWHVYRDGRVGGPYYSESPSSEISTHRTLAAAQRAARAYLARMRAMRVAERGRSGEDVIS